MSNITNFPQRTWYSPLYYAEILVVPFPFGTIVAFPIYGRRVTINGTTRVLDSDPTPVTISGLLGSTLYYVYGAASGASGMSLELSTTATDGFSKIGDPTRIFLGAVFTNPTATAWQHGRSKYGFTGARTSGYIAGTIGLEPFVGNLDTAVANPKHQVGEVGYLMLPGETVKVTGNFIVGSAAAELTAYCALGRSNVEYLRAGASFDSVTNVYTVDTTSAHGISIGDYVWIRDTSNSANAVVTDGKKHYVNSVPSITTFSFNDSDLTSNTPGICSYTKSNDWLTDSSTGHYRGAVGSSGYLTQTIGIDGRYTNPSNTNAALVHFTMSCWRAIDPYALGAILIGAAPGVAPRSSIHVEQVETLGNFYQ